MSNYTKHLVTKYNTVKEILLRLDFLASEAIVFLVNEENRLLGAITDGDIRRGLIKGLNLEDKPEKFMNDRPRFIRKDSFTLEEIIAYRKQHIRVIPVLNKSKQVVNVVNFDFFKSYLPIHAVIMAGGRGSRLKPLTDSTPKPMLSIGDKPIIEHNLDRLRTFGIDHFSISIRYLGAQIVDYFKDGSDKNIEIEYLNEDEPLGTIGALAGKNDYKHDTVLVTNSDLLTNLDYEEFYLHFQDQEADISVVTIPYQVNIPYAVVETGDDLIVGFKEKPTYTYYSNAGIYLIKSRILDRIPKGTFYNATDLLESVMKSGGRVSSFNFQGYWLDIGRKEDFDKAKEDIKNIRF
ncbi:nucleotidyltransferase [Roseivirga sp. 4D4]|uniref:nucleotidyltransferase family protein n=1 Tax=Roseivirga sp. 4D4 TaxID=1889784 RepID=UPI0008531810|nr:nucleotidyltransferase family protein [Roseivirga sp. 4D4]OEK01631.1 nucleotidyltransferase [Roseivirga sp. 4D4]